VFCKNKFELGHSNGDRVGYNGFHAPIDGFRFGFQRMDDKAKDGLVLSVVWS
jgi:hypothetical protein